MKEKIICAGFGGQGIMFLGKLVAFTMMHEDKHVTYIPSYGPEMRGGTANCNVIVSDDEIDSPMVDEADTVIVMNQPSYEKFKNSVRPGGLLVVNTSLINPADPPENVRLLEVPATRMANEMGNVRLANMIILGVYNKVRGLTDKQKFFDALPSFLGGKKERFIPVNKEAVNKGVELYETTS
jgi:2-oxoglutarate ferredoxin oxidoreductase subunit gamma